MRIENPVWQRFPTQIVPESRHSPRWMPLRASAPGADTRIVRQSRPYWFTDLSGCQCNEVIKNRLYAMLWRNKGRTKPVLVYVPTFCEIGQTGTARDDNGTLIPTPEFQGTIVAGAEGNHVIQLKKRLWVEGYDSEYDYYDVTKPNIDYPIEKGLSYIINSDGELVATDYEPMPELALYLDDVEQDRWAYTVDRDTGIVTWDDSLSGDVSATGGFYILMLMPNEIPMQNRGGMYIIDQGIALEEPLGGR